MDLGFLAEYAVPTIMVLCLCIGFIIKNAITTDKINKFIPLIVGTIGGLMNIWINKDITPDIITTGIFSGLSSTGFYELFKKFINGEIDIKNFFQLLVEKFKKK